MIEEKDNYYPIVPLGDLHVGYSTSNLEKAKKVIKYIKDSGAEWLGMGDYIDNTPPSHKYYRQDTTIDSPQDQVFTFVDMVRPIRKQCLGLLYGNHEMRSIDNKTGYDPIKQMEYMLDLPTCYRQLGTQHYFTMVDDSAEVIYKIFATHGKSRGWYISTKKSTKIRKLLNLQELADADLYLMGHVHDWMHFQQQTIEGYHKLRKRWFVQTGAFVEYFGSYGEDFGYTPVETGANVVWLNKKKKDIRVERIV